MTSWRLCGLAALLLSPAAVLGVASSGVACSGSSNAQDGGQEAPPPPHDGVYLRSLSVSLPTIGDASAPPALTPAFAWDIHDYYVPCAAGMNTGTIAMTASPGADSQLLSPTPASAKAPSQTLPLSVDEGRLIEAVATKGTVTTEYWVRCLPHGLPEIQWVLHPEVGTPKPGYYLLGDAYPLPNVLVGWAIVLDSHGVPVWYFKEVDDGVYDTDVLVPGTITFFPSPPVPNRTSPPWELHTLSPSKVTGIGPGGADTDNHELQRVAKNGHYFLYTIPIETGFDLTGLTITGEGTAYPLGPDENIASSKILEVDPTTGKTVWTWDVTEHFDPKTACTYPRTGAGNWHAATNPKPVFDVFHLNSIDVDLGSDGLPRGLLLSARNMDSVFYVDYASQKVLWKMGGTTVSKDRGVTYLPSLSDPFYRQHDARLLPGWDSSTCGGRGKISVFDDETDVGKARGVVYDVTVRSDGTSACASPGASVTWQYQGQLTSLFMGSFRVQPDGAGVIGWGTPANGNGPVFTEVDPAQNDLLDLNLTNAKSTPTYSYRAIKVPVSALDLGQMRKTAGVQVMGW